MPESSQAAPYTPGQSKALELLWGAEAIGAVIGRSARATFHLLEKGELPAKKIGGRWVIERGKLLAAFTEMM